MKFLQFLTTRKSRKYWHLFPPCYVNAGLIHTPWSSLSTENDCDNIQLTAKLCCKHQNAPIVGLSDP